MVINKVNANNFPKWSDIHTIVFDFDGVFTNNKVYISEEGLESIKCDRSDSLGLDILRKFIFLKQWDLDYFILTRETNQVVTKRAQKLKINCFQSVDNKLAFLKKRLNDRFKEIHDSRNGLVYLGNDLNDYSAMKFAGYSLAPNDANQFIKDNCNIVLNSNGGSGFVREFIDNLLDLNQLDDILLDNLL